LLLWNYLSVCMMDYADRNGLLDMKVFSYATYIFLIAFITYQVVTDSDNGEHVVLGEDGCDGIGNVESDLCNIPSN